MQSTQPRGARKSPGRRAAPGIRLAATGGVAVEPRDGGISQTDFLRELKHVRMPDYRPDAARWTIRGRTIKAVARELADYAHWSSGEGMHPSLAALALGAQVDYRSAARAVEALAALGLIERTEDTRGYPQPNGYRLLNPHLSDRVTVLTPAQFREAADALYDKAKGRRRPPA